MSNQVPPGPGQPPYPGAEPPYEPYSSQAPGMPPQGSSTPPPPGPYPQDPPPPYGQPSYGPDQPSYGPEPSYGPGQQQYGPAPQPYGQPSEPSYGPPSGQEQPSYGGYDPAQAGYGAPGYQPGQGQGLPPGGYVPSYGGPQPGAPKGGSAAKIVAIAAGAVVFVGLVAGGVYLLTRDGGDPVADKTTSSSPKASKTSATPRPTASSTPKQSSRPTEMTSAEAAALAEMMSPGITATYDWCTASTEPLFVEGDLEIACYGDDLEPVSFYIWDGTDAADGARQSFANRYIDDAQESTWDHGTQFAYDASPVYYQLIRCYSDTPVCVEAWRDTKEESDAVLGGISYLDAAGIAALNDRLAEGF